jgi:DNA (cytosine-5)-methyltransferase 1
LITAATLFSGIGAPEVAMPHWQWLWHAEIEKFPAAVMAKCHPGSVNLGDVTRDGFTEKAARIGRPDVLVFGSPCQSFSIAGKRLGLDDARGNLALCALGIVARLKPDWFVFENVPGLFSSFSGSEHAAGELQHRIDAGDVAGTIDGQESRDFAAFLSGVSDIGYSGCWSVLDAQWRGVAQRRERVFFVGYLGDWRPSAAVLLEPESLCGDRPTRGEAGQGATGTIKRSLERCSADEAECGTLIAGTLGTRSAARPAGTKNESEFMVRVAGSVLSKWAKGTGGPAGDEAYNLVAHALTSHMGRGGATEDGTGRGIPIVASPISSNEGKTYSHGGNNAGHLHNVVVQPQAVAFSENQRAETTLNDTAGSLKVGGGKPGQGFPAVLQGAVAFQTRGSNLDVGDVAGTFGTNADRASGSAPMAMQSAAVRRLTPRECCRLQGFPDDYTLIPFRGKPAADGPRYRALGNSMAVPVVRMILERIELFETRIKPRLEQSKP